MSVHARRAAALMTVAGLWAAPLLPPAHLHRNPLGSAWARPLVHRHFAPHASPMGAHIERAGVAEGAPEWLDEPYGSLPHRPAVTADTTIVALQVICCSAARGEYVAPNLAPVSRYSPGPAPPLRGPPVYG
jgi:hypothetical protein